LFDKTKLDRMMRMICQVIFQLKILDLRQDQQLQELLALELEEVLPTNFGDPKYFGLSSLEELAQVDKRRSCLRQVHEADKFTFYFIK